MVKEADKRGLSEIIKCLGEVIELPENERKIILTSNRNGGLIWNFGMHIIQALKKSKGSL